MNNFRITTLTLILICFLGSCREKEDTPTRINLEELTIKDIHKAYISREFTSQQLVQAYLDRIAQLDSSTNSITYVNPNALSKAKYLDETLDEHAELKALHGIPIIVKDNINVIGMPTTAGSNALIQYYPKEDAFVIQKLKEAGAIVLAKSNMAEWAFSPMHTESSTHGTTRNPYNLDYVPAGSSGGTAASIAANMGTVGLGTDTGNSIRGPSSHCALVGFRTTLGLISRSGIVPLMLRNDVVGPMCRTVEDATRVMEIMVGYDSTDQITEYSKGKSTGNYRQYLVENGLEGSKIGVLRELMDENTDSEIEQLFDHALEDLRELGAEVWDPVVIPNFQELRQDHWCSTFKIDLETFLQEYVRSDTLQGIQDIIQIGTSSEFTRGRLSEYASKVGRWGKGQDECLDAYHDSRRIAFRKAIRTVMDSLKLDAIVYPSWSIKPATIDRFEEEYGGDNNQVISPHTGQPAFTVPMGFLTGNLPVGIQFLGRMYDEGTLVKLAYAYEQGTQHRKPPE